MRAPRALAAAVAATGIIAVAAGCGSAPAPAGPTGVGKPDITVGVVPAVSNAGVYIADQRGFFTAEGLHVKLVPITSSADVLAVLLDGNVDVLAGNYVSEIQAEANNPGAIRLRVLAEGALTTPRSRAIMIPKGSPIRTLAQLRGKTVAVNALNNAASMLVDSALAANGIPVSSVHLAAIGFPAEAAALNAHRPVDRTSGVSSTAAALVAAGFVPGVIIGAGEDGRTGGSAPAGCGGAAGDEGGCGAFG